MIAPGTANQEIRLDRIAAGVRVGARFQLRDRVRQLALDATGVAVAAVMLFPIYWMVATAFKPGRDILRLTPKAYEGFRKDVQRGGWTEVESADGLVSVNLDAVVFVKLDTGDHRVGFSGL